MSFIRKSLEILNDLPKQYAVPSSEENIFSASEVAIGKVLSSFGEKTILKSKYLKQIQKPFQDAYTIWCHNADSADISNRYKTLVANVKIRIGKLPSVKAEPNLLNNVKTGLDQAVAVHNKIVDEVKDWTPTLCKECGVDLNDLSQTVSTCSKLIDSAISLCKSAASTWDSRLQASKDALNQCKTADGKVASSSPEIKQIVQHKKAYMEEIKKYPNVAEFRQSELLRFHLKNFLKLKQTGNIDIESLQLENLELIQKILSTREIPQQQFFARYLFPKFPYIKRLFEVGDSEKAGWELAGMRIKKVVPLRITKLNQQNDTVFLQKVKQASSEGNSIDKLERLLSLCKVPEFQKVIRTVIKDYTGASYWLYNGVLRGCCNVRGNPFMTQVQELEKLNKDNLIEPELWAATILEIRKLQREITSNKTKDPMTVWRRVQYETCRDTIFKSKFPDLVDLHSDYSDATKQKFKEQMNQIAASRFTIIDLGFLSTTLQPGGIPGFGEVLFTIDVPAGTPGIDVSKCSKHPNEKEILFPKSIKCQIQSLQSTFSSGDTIVEFKCKFIN